MTDSLQSRGPDDAGIWADETVGVAIGHRRLSIIDTSLQGHQPMESADGRYVFSYNGELYNFQDLRAELEHAGHVFRGGSDTEVALEAFATWGVAASLQRFNGMFAFALWDRQEQTLHLGRDRLGEKPLYLGWGDGVFLFGSELKAFRAHCRFRPRINRRALVLFMQYGYVPAPFSIYEDVYKLTPGTVLSVGRLDYDRADLYRPQPSMEEGFSPRPYWELPAEQEALCPDVDTAADRVSDLLMDSVKRRMIADVPLGMFLSGGVDSATIVALACATGNRIPTFTMGFDDRRYDESSAAAAVARHLGTEHTQLHTTSKEAAALLPELPRIYDEPFADPSQIPTYLLSHLTREHVTVCLAGDGADELFGGYGRYEIVRRLRSLLAYTRPAVRRSVASMLDAMPSRVINRTLGPLARLVSSGAMTTTADKVRNLADYLRCRDVAELYHRLITAWPPAAAVVVDAPSAVESILPAYSSDDELGWMTRADLMTYLPDDILVKVDRASMAVGLEVRAPYLDHRLVELSRRLLSPAKVGVPKGKWVLRKILSRYVPDGLMARPKHGFGVPLDEWLRGPLRGWAEALLSPDRLRREGFLAPEPVSRIWSEHLSGESNWEFRLWNVLTFQSWLQEHHGSG